MFSIQNFFIYVLIYVLHDFFLLFYQMMFFSLFVFLVLAKQKQNILLYVKSVLHIDYICIL